MRETLQDTVFKFKQFEDSRTQLKENLDAEINQKTLKVNELGKAFDSDQKLIEKQKSEIQSKRAQDVKSVLEGNAASAKVNQELESVEA